MYRNWINIRQTANVCLHQRKKCVCLFNILLLRPILMLLATSNLCIPWIHNSRGLPCCTFPSCHHQKWNVPPVFVYIKAASFCPKISLLSVHVSVSFYETFWHWKNIHKSFILSLSKNSFFSNHNIMLFLCLSHQSSFRQLLSRKIYIVWF